MDHDAPSKVANMTKKAGQNSNYSIHYERHEALVWMVSLDPLKLSPRYMVEEGTAVWIVSPCVASAKGYGHGNNESLLDMEQQIVVYRFPKTLNPPLRRSIIF